jgi:hypothetical protein
MHGSLWRLECLLAVACLERRIVSPKSSLLPDAAVGHSACQQTLFRKRTQPKIKYVSLVRRTGVGELRCHLALQFRSLQSDYANDDGQEELKGVVIGKCAGNLNGSKIEDVH